MIQQVQNTHNIECKYSKGFCQRTKNYIRFQKKVQTLLIDITLKSKLLAPVGSTGRERRFQSAAYQEAAASAYADRMQHSMVLDSVAKKAPRREEAPTPMEDF